MTFLNCPILRLIVTCKLRLQVVNTQILVLEPRPTSAATAGHQLKPEPEPQPQRHLSQRLQRRPQRQRHLSQQDTP